jgi:hypothetical protein
VDNLAGGFGPVNNKIGTSILDFWDGGGKNGFIAAKTVVPKTA